MSINEFESVAVIITRDKKLTSLVRRMSLRNLLVRRKVPTLFDSCLAVHIYFATSLARRGGPSWRRSFAMEEKGS